MLLHKTSILEDKLIIDFGKCSDACCEWKIARRVRRHFQIALKSPRIKLDFRFPFFRPSIHSSRRSGAPSPSLRPAHNFYVCSLSIFIDPKQHFLSVCIKRREKFFIRAFLLSFAVAVTFQLKSSSSSSSAQRGGGNHSIHRDLILLYTTQFLLLLFVSGRRIQKNRTEKQ